MTTKARTDKLAPLEKFDVLAGDIDALRQRVETLTAEKSVDDLVDVIELDSLGQRFGVSLQTIKKRLESAGGQVFKLGKKQVIRKVKFLEALEQLEAQA